MNAQQLRNSILQEAIEGRLVPQDPNDEPASTLLQRIRAEKEQLAKAGKLKKKDLEVIPISEDEIPFEIPDSWEWCRLGDIGIFERGNGIKRDETQNNGYPCVRYGEMYTKYRLAPTFNKTISFTSLSVFEKCRKAHSGDLFMALTGENKQDIALAAQYVGEDDVAVGGDLCHFTIITAYPLYFVYLINSCYFSSKKEVLATGDIIVHISTDKLASIPIPLPPLAEQKRIVAKIEELLPKVEEYGKAQEKLNKLNEELPEKLKKSILQEAIEGRLVPQDSNDEPASALLAKIREEKKQLVKEGKLKKKDLEEKPISEDEIPFSIPDSWEWVKLFDLIEILYGYPFDSTMFNEIGMGFPMIRIRDVLPAKTRTYTTEKADERYIIKKGDMIVGMDGNFNVNYWNSDDAYLNQRVLKIKAKDDYLCQRFLFYYLPIALDYIFQTVSYVTVKHLSDKHMRSMYIPLPPLAEQKRIVEKLEQLFQSIDKLKK